MKTEYDVSVVIVCMNNYGQLADCLDSIKKYTTRVSYEVLLVAYFFSPENLERLRREYPWVKVIESDEIRGFSANNNLALRQARGEYCFVLNDDTYLTMPAIDMLYERAKAHPEVTILSPQIVKPDGKIQYSGTKPVDWRVMIRNLYKLDKGYDYDPTGKWTKPTGFFQTYNILGAAFFIKTDVFRELGWLDELYFYGPEDIAFSTLVNERGGTVFVDTDIKIVHLGGVSGGPTSKTVCATRPASRKGSALFHSRGNKSLYVMLETLIWFNSFILALAWLAKSASGSKTARYSMMANINVCRSIFSGKSTTEIFKKFYKAK